MNSFFLIVTCPVSSTFYYSSRIPFCIRFSVEDERVKILGFTCLCVCEIQDFRLDVKLNVKPEIWYELFY